MTEIKKLPANMPLADDLLAGHNIIITGADAELGAAVARECARLGATVILVGANVKPLEALYDEIEQTGAAQPALVPFDLATASDADFVGFGNTLAEEFEHINGIAHCHVDYGILSPLALYNLDTWAHTLRTTLAAPYLLTRACFTLLERADAASVVFVTHSSGRHAKAYWGAHGVASAAIENLAATWADETENAGTLRFNTLDTGPVRTAARTRIYPGEEPESLPEVNVIAPAFCYILGSDNADSGKTFVIDTPQAC